MLNRFEAAFLAYSEIFKFDVSNYLHSLGPVKIYAQIYLQAPAE